MDVSKLVENAKAMWSEMNTTSYTPIHTEDSSTEVPEQAEDGQEEATEGDATGDSVFTEEQSEEGVLLPEQSQSEPSDEIPESTSLDPQFDREDEPYEYNDADADDTVDGQDAPQAEMVRMEESPRPFGQKESSESLGIDNNDPGGQFDQENFDIWSPDFSGDDDQAQPQSEKRTEDDLVRVIDESAADPSVPHQNQQHRSMELKLPDDWQEGISSVVQQQMYETQEIVKAHLDDSMARSLYHLNILGGG
jgi:hypothetical protein